MAYTFDAEKRTITLPRGDTIDMPIRISGLGVTDGDAVVFGLWNITSGTWTLKKHAIIADGVANIRVTSADTRSLSFDDEYGWSMTVVTDPNIQDGVVIAEDDSDDVYTIFDKFQPFRLTEGGVMGE